MIYPYEEESGGLGHYDLQFVGNYTFDGVKYTNPVFTYDNDNGTGFLGILTVAFPWPYTRSFCRSRDTTTTESIHTQIIQHTR